MVLTHEEILQKIKNPAFKGFVEMAQRVQKDHDRHVSGKDFKYLVKPLDGYEKEDEKKIKDQLAQPATVSIVSDIKSNLSKWQHATDTYKNYVFSNPELKTEFKKDVLSKVWKGESMEYFINYFLKNALWNKFNDFLVVEQPPQPILKQVKNKTYKVEIRDGVEKIFTDKKLIPYIAHISVNRCHDFLVFGNKVEYLIYVESKTDAETIYRILDDNGIYTYKQKTGSLESNDIAEIDFTPGILEELPCIRISSLLSNIYPNTSTSYLEPALTQLNAYVNDYAIGRVSFISHAYPQRYTASTKCMYQDESRDSSVCEGKGKIDITDGGERKQITCPACNGSGRKKVENASQDFEVPFFLEEGQRPYASSPIGYANVDISILKFQDEKLKDNENSIKETILNKNILLENSIQKTATAVLENTEPIVLLNMAFAKLVSFVEEKLTTWIGKSWNANYEKTIVNYGLNYANKNKSQITDEITKSRTAGISISEITNLHENRIKSANSKDYNKLVYSQLLFELEPFNTMTIDEVEKSQTISLIDKMEKIYFMEYINELNEKNEIDISLLSDKENYNSIYSTLKEKIKQLNKSKYDSSKITPTDGRENGTTIQDNKE